MARTTPSIRRRPVVGRAGALAVVVMLGAAACGGNSGKIESSEAGFCETGRQNIELITNPPLSTPDQVDESIEFYKLMGQLAPVEIAEDWNQIVTAMETADNLVPGDPESEQLVAQSAYAAELAGHNVSKWFAENCDLEIPNVTIVPHETAPPLGPFESAPPQSTEDGSGPQSTEQSGEGSGDGTTAAP